MKTAWEYFNGKKTLIAAGVLILSVFLSEVIVGIWGFNPDWMGNLIRTLDWFGMVFGGAGLTHKGFKAIEPCGKSN